MRITVLLLLFFFCFSFYGQRDTIVFKNGLRSIVSLQKYTRKKVEVIIVDEGESKNLTLKKRKIRYVIDSTGSTHWPKIDPLRFPPLETYTKNLFDVDLSAIPNKNISVSYMHLFCKGQIGVRIPFKVDFDYQRVYPYGAFKSRHEKFRSGIELSFFPGGQKKLRYYLGASLFLSVADYFNHEYSEYCGKYGDSFCSAKYFDNVLIISLPFQNGFMWKINKHAYLDTGIQMGPSINMHKWLKLYSWLYIAGHIKIGWSF